MSKGTQGALYILLGLILALGGVGGVETSLDTITMMQAVVVALVGVVFMMVGTSLINDNTQEFLGRYR